MFLGWMGDTQPSLEVYNPDLTEGGPVRRVNVPRPVLVCERLATLYMYRRIGGETTLTALTSIRSSTMDPRAYPGAHCIEFWREVVGGVLRQSIRKL
jgi:hypothetical protein